MESITKLTINGEEYEAKGSFMFKRHATKQYSKKEEDKTVDGFDRIYGGVIERDPEALSMFWDCALSHLGKKKPAVEDIEDALMEAIQENDDTLPLLVGAAEVLDDSAFFRRKSEQYWFNVDQAYRMAKTEEEKEERKKQAAFLKEMHTGLKPKK